MKTRYYLIFKVLLCLILFSGIGNTTNAQQSPCPDPTNININHIGPAQGGQTAYLVSWTTSPGVNSYSVDVKDINNNIVYSVTTSPANGSATIYTNLNTFWVTVTAHCANGGSSGVGTEGITTVLDVPISDYNTLCDALPVYLAIGEHTIVGIDPFTEEKTTFSLYGFCMLFCVSIHGDICDPYLPKSNDINNLKLQMPNPVHDETVLVNYFLPAPSNVYLTIFDIQGRAVRQVIEGEHIKQGSHNFKTNLSGLQKGVYIIELMADGLRKQMKFVKM